MTAPHGLRPLLLALLLLLPAAGATTGPAPPEDFPVRVEPFHAGDRLRYETDRAGVAHLVEVLGPTDAADLHGVLRPARAFRHEVVREGAIVGGELCHLAGAQPVRREGAWGQVAMTPGEPGKPGRDAEGRSLLYPTAHAVGFAIHSDFPPVCAHPFMGQTSLGGRTFVAGDRIRPADLHPGRVSTPDGLSQPALPTTFHGRPALEFRFNDTRGATLRYVVADGLPGLVAWGGATGGVQLAGFQPGVGPATDVAPTPPAAAHDAPNPRAGFTPPVGTTLDEAALDLPYPFAEAFEALLDDRKVGLREFLLAHPGAVLTYAEYDRWKTYDEASVSDPRGGLRSGDGFDTDGGWRMYFTDGTSAFDATTTRLSGVRAPDQPLARMPVTTTRNAGETDEPEPAPRLARSIDGETLARLAEAHGVRVGTVESLRYRAWATDEGEPRARVFVSDVAYRPDGQPGKPVGHMVEIVPEDGRVRAVWATTRTSQEPVLSGILPGSAGGVPPPPARLAETTAPLVVQRGEGLAGTPALGPAAVAGAAAATALLLALLALKLAVPLYTRLRRERLLDHPARARLVEMVRAKPGIRHAELLAAMDLSRGTVQHHLDQLVRHDLLVPLRAGNDATLGYCVAGALPPHEARRLSLLRRGHLGAVHDLYRAEPTLSLREAARRLGIRAPSVHKARRKLEAEGLLPRKAP